MSQEPKVADVMEKAVLGVDMNENAAVCSKAMTKRGVSCAVITHMGAAVGIVTERDLVSKVLADTIDPVKVLVRDIMSTPLVTIEPDAPLAQAVALMDEYLIRRLVVVDRNGGLVGIVTTGDIAKVHAKEKGFKDPMLNALARYKGGEEGGPYR
jgi:CBS domain-containing protein